MKKLLLIVFSLISTVSFSQDWDIETPDYKRIEKNIQDSKSNLFYDSLMTRYAAGDSTLNTEEKRHLYYGYTFQDAYAPYAFSSYRDSLATVLNQERLDTAAFELIIQYTDVMLSENPFDMRALNYQLYSLEQIGNFEAFNIRVEQFSAILDAIISSGYGTSKEEAFYVISTSHEYEMLGILGFEFGGQQSLIEHYDYLTLKENNAELEGLYFDVSPCLNSLNSMFKE